MHFRGFFFHKLGSSKLRWEGRDRVNKPKAWPKSICTVYMGTVLTGMNRWPYIVTSLGKGFFGNTFSTVPSLQSLKNQNNGGLKRLSREID